MSKNPAVLLLEHHLKELKLPTFLRDHDSVGAVCSQERCDYPTYLLRLAERELIDRERRATERRIKEAAFPVLKTIETFDFAAQVSINEPLVRELLRGEYISKRENLLLVGNPGTGKTHLATALGFAACSQGKRVRFMTTTGLVTQLLEQRETRTLQRLHKQLERLDVLVLDELGYVPFSKTGAELLFDVVSRAYERTSLIVTTNLPFEQWTEVMGSERLSEAACRSGDAKLKTEADATAFSMLRLRRAHVTGLCNVRWSRTLNHQRLLLFRIGGLLRSRSWSPRLATPVLLR